MIAVVAHDAGGAEVLSSYVRRSNLRYIYALDGPARAVFERKLGAVENLEFEEAIGRASSVLCGTSWQSDLEWRAIRQARGMAKRSVAFLDHWVNYRERFVRAGEVSLPDEIWVGDHYALDRARSEFPDAHIVEIENPYFLDLRRDVSAALKRRVVHTEHHGTRVLYVCEPISDHAMLQHGNPRHWGYTEEDALRYALAHLNIIGAPIGRVVIRPHPAEAPGKYSWARGASTLDVVLSDGRSLIEEIVDADVVVGSRSMAMVVALLAGKRVISCIPPGGTRCELPQKAIERLCDLVEGQA